MRPDTAWHLLWVALLWSLGIRLFFFADFTGPLLDVPFGDFQALVLLAAVITGFK